MCCCGRLVSFIVGLLRVLFHPLLVFLSPKHDLPFATPNRSPPDPAVFPRYIQNRQGIWLHWQHWGTIKQPKGIVFLIGGYGEHFARYDSIALKLNKEGFHCFLLEHQGHGLSEGDRLYVERFQDYVEDQLLFVREVTQRVFPELHSLPRFLLGHSMGGLIAVHVAFRDATQWTAVVLSGPCLEPDPETATPLMKLLAQVFSTLLPKLGVKGLNTKLITRNAQVYELAMQDPCYPKIPMKARWGYEVLLAMDDVWSSMEKANFPFLIVHGTEDKLCSLIGSRRFVLEAPSKSKRLIEFRGFCHEVLTDEEHDKVWSEVCLFFESFVVPDMP